MRRLTIISVLLLMVSTLWALPADQTQKIPFSATLLTTSPAGHVDRGKVDFDGSWLRMEGDSDGPDVVILEQIGNRSYVTLFPQNKTYSRALILWPEDSQASALLPCPDIPQISCAKTGEDTTHGRPTEIWLLTSKVTGEKLSTRWVDKRLQFAIRTKHANGTVVELVDITERRPPKQLFTIPKGYVDAYFPPPPLNEFEEFLTTILPQARVPFSANVSVNRARLMTRKARIYFDGKHTAMELGSYVVLAEEDGRTRTVVNHRSKESFRSRSPKPLEIERSFKPCATLVGFACEKTLNETKDGRSTEKWVFRRKEDGAWFATVWYDEALHFPVHAITDEVSVLDADMLKEGTPDRAAFQLPSDYRELGSTVLKPQPICGMVNAPVPCTVR